MNKRQTMYNSNTMVKDFLLEREFDEIYFKPHVRRLDKVYAQPNTITEKIQLMENVTHKHFASMMKNSYFMQRDLFGLFDGICLSQSDTVWYLQMKTNQWAKDEELKEFPKKHHVHILSFNVTNKLKECRKILDSGKKSSVMEWKVLWRSFE